MAPVGKVPRVLWALGAQCSPTRTWMPNSRPRASATKAGSVFSGTTGTTAARFSAPARPTSRRLGMDAAPRRNRSVRACSWARMASMPVSSSQVRAA